MNGKDMCAIVKFGVILIIIVFIACDMFFYTPEPTPILRLKECSKEWIDYKANQCYYRDTGCLANVQFEINKTCLNK